MKNEAVDRPTSVSLMQQMMGMVPLHAWSGHTDAWEVDPLPAGREKK